MKIYLIRHGEKKGHGFEAKLTRSGKDQILSLARKTKHFLPKKIYSSSNPRSVESCKILTKELDSNFKIIENIREIERGTFFVREDDLKHSEIENLRNIRKFLKDTIEKGQDVALVMNAGINRFILCELLDYPLSNAYAFTQNFGSISEIEQKEIYNKKIWCLNSINLY